jgi:hypothetical protein
MPGLQLEYVAGEVGIRVSRLFQSVRGTQILRLHNKLANNPALASHKPLIFIESLFVVLPPHGSAN